MNASTNPLRKIGIAGAAYAYAGCTGRRHVNRWGGVVRRRVCY